jgi:16S rRNA (cytosine967-C5)-methyltransferase
MSNTQIQPERACSAAGERLRRRHLVRFLEEFDPSRGPVDLAWRSYAKRHPVLGSKDRQWLGEKIYLHEKRKCLFDFLAEDDLELRAEMLARWPDLPTEWLAECSQAQQLGCPTELWVSLCEAYGEQKAAALAAVSLEEAPLFLRVNAQLRSRESLLSQLQAMIPGARACEQAPFGIELPARSLVTQLAEFRAGQFEIQDEASQLVAGLCAVRPGDEVLDFCAGAGGKALAIASGMRGKGQLFLHDVRERALAEAKLRLRRAGVQNAQVVHPGSRALKCLTGRCDWVFVDAPCSGTGTLRRNPDMKWRFSRNELSILVELQRQILTEAMRCVKSTGRLVYATCSILPQENQIQRQWLEQQGWHCLQEWQSLPESGKMDGLYGAVFQRHSSS